MAIDVRMPKLSDNMEEGVIIRWMKAPGDQVAKGEPLAEVETDKADVELEASESGVLREIKVAEGESAAVGAVIAVLASDGEAVEAGDGGKAPAAPRRAAAARGEEASGEKASGEAPKTSAATAERRASATAQGTRERRPAAVPRAADGPGARDGAAELERATGEAPRERGSTSAREDRSAREAGAESGRRSRQAPDDAGAEHAVRASPLAWRLAEEAGINLANVRGTGPGGRILQRDVEASVRAPAGAAARRRDAGESADEEGAGDVSARQPAERPQAGSPRVVEVTRMRMAIANRMAEAKREIPHFYVAADIDMSEAMRLRASIKQSEAMPGLTVTHLLLRALAIALVRHPQVNASWRDGAIEYHDDVNIGIAVAVEDGLVVPVLHRAQTLMLGEIVERANRLTEKARSGKFSGPELTGGTFSLSNVGMLAVDELVAVINPPQAAILAVGAVKDRPIVRDGQLAVAKTLRATLSCDHRVLNGVEGGRFLEELKTILENPVTLLLE